MFRETLSGVFFHFLAEALFVLLRHVFELLLHIRRESPPVFSEHGAHFHEFDARVFGHYFGTFLEGEEDEGSAGTFGLIGVLSFLHVLFVEATIFDEVSLGVVTRRGAANVTRCGNG